jgi:hypothetical protein
MEVLKLGLEKMLCTLGIFDIPIIQLQPPFVVDLLDSNIALFGSAMSGKTTFIKTLVNILHKQYDKDKNRYLFLILAVLYLSAKICPWFPLILITRLRSMLSVFLRLWTTS